MSGAASSLIGVQVDYTKLDDTLHRILTGQQQLAQDVRDIAARLKEVENKSEHNFQHISRVEKALAGFGGADDLRSLAQHVNDIGRGMDAVVQRDVPELKRRVEELANSHQVHSRAVAQATETHLPQLERAVQEASKVADANHRDLAQLSTTTRELSQQLLSQQRDAETRERGQGNFASRVDEALRDVGGRLEEIERGQGAGVEELSKRVDDNFREIERQLAAAGGDLNRNRSDVANLRAELNQVDNDKSAKMAEMADESEAKFAMMLKLLQDFETSNSVQAAHIAEAGRALVNPRAPSAAGSDFGGTVGGSTWMPAGPATSGRAGSAAAAYR